MKNILLFIIVASSVLIIITFFAIDLWLQMSDVEISNNGIIAIFVGAFFTILLGSGLMALIFFSSRYGFDDQVEHDLDRLSKKHTNS
ncbi:MAG: hypothetical protein O3A39_05505 [Proteobacteria bacterium]|nr:hypothetical protein [Pseudomonadota bacterium]MDA1135811.1 hypothetical protein [Pseudomonadota bacterium]